MIPPSYSPASLRAVLPVDLACDRIGIAFDTDQGAVRVAIPVADAGALASLIADYIRPELHADKSSGSPSCEGSPQEGQNV